LKKNQQEGKLMAELIINVCDITVSLSAVEKLEALHGNVTVSRSAVARVRTVPDGMVEVHGLRAPGTGLPGVIKVGTWRSREGKTFAVCHGRRPAIVLELVGAPYNRLVVTLDDPELAMRSLG
jgi:hypothetical protein